MAFALSSWLQVGVIGPVIAHCTRNAQANHFLNQRSNTDQLEAGNDLNVPDYKGYMKSGLQKGKLLNCCFDALYVLLTE